MMSNTLDGLPLFEARPDSPAQELARVASNLASPIVRWVALRRISGQRVFRLAELSEALEQQGLKFAPDSPRRILGELRRKGLVGVTLESRADSLYRVSE